MSAQDFDRAAAETKLLRFLLARLPKHQCVAYSDHFRHYAAGDPAERDYIARLIERREVAGRPSVSGGEDT